MAREINIGDIFSSNNYGDFEIISESNERKYRAKTYNIKFLLTGTEKQSVTRTDILRGEVKDVYYPSICGIACIGNVIQKNHKKEYSCWKHMIHRCYNPNDNNYKYYGEKGVIVEKSWLCFENYLNDIKNLKGYDEEQFQNGQIKLDKDKNSNEFKIYSKNTCEWISQQENLRISINKKYGELIAISPKGIIYEYNHIIDCAKENNLSSDCIAKCLANKQKSHKGWKFKRK